MIFDFKQLTYRQSTEDVIIVTDQNINVINLDHVKVITQAEGTGPENRGRESLWYSFSSYIKRTQEIVIKNKQKKIYKGNRKKTF